MSRARSELRGRRGRWLLEVLVGGRELLFADAPCSVVDGQGRERVYAEGLGDLRLGVASEGTIGQAVPVTVLAPASWEAMVSPRRPLEYSRARLLRWLEGDPYELARVVIAGVVQGVTHGARMDPIGFSVVRLPVESSSSIPSPRMVVDASTWPVRSGWSVDEAAIGAGYPMPIGRPGLGGLPASPALVVETAHSTDTTDRLLIAGGPVAAASVTLFDLTDDAAPESAVVAVIHARDLTGRLVALVEPDGAFTESVGPGRRYAVAWDVAGGGLIDGSTGAELRGAGDVLAWLLRTWAGVPFDAGAFAQARDMLNAYQIDTFVDAPTSATELAAELAAALPVSARESQRGAFFGLRPLEIRPEAAVAHLDADRLEVSRDGDVEIRSDGLVNELSVLYAPAGSTSRYTRRVLLTGGYGPDPLDPAVETGTDSRVLVDYRAALSRQRYGVRPLEIELAHTWDPATAVRVGLDVLAEQSRPRRYVRYTGGAELEALSPDDIALVTDSEILLDREPAVVLDVQVGGPDVAVDLMIADDPALERRDPAVQLVDELAPDPSAFRPADIGWDLWYDALDADARTLGGDGLIALLNKGTLANADIGSGNVNGIPLNAWSVAGEAVLLPGPVTVANPNRALYSPNPITPLGIPYTGKYTFWALIPITPYALGNNNTYFVLRNADISEELGLFHDAASGITLSAGAAGWSTGSLAISSTAPGALHAAGAAAGDYLVVIFRSDGDNVTSHAWYRRGSTSTYVAPATIPDVLGFPDPSTSRCVVGGREGLGNTWAGLIHSVAYVARKITDDEVQDLAAWSAALLGWPGVPT